MSDHPGPVPSFTVTTKGWKAPPWYFSLLESVIVGDDYNGKMTRVLDDSFTLAWIFVKEFGPSHFRRLRVGQKVNMLPGHWVFCAKDQLARQLERAWHTIEQRTDKETADRLLCFWPRSWDLPRQLHKLHEDWTAKPGQGIILKPPGSSRGRKILLARDLAEVDDLCLSGYVTDERPLAQEYIAAPLTVGGRKTSMRVFVAVTGVDPLRVFMYDQVLVRFAGAEYSGDPETYGDISVHLTNVDQQDPSNALKDMDLKRYDGFKCDWDSLIDYLERTRGADAVDATAIWDGIRDLVAGSMLACEAELTSVVLRDVPSRFNAFEVYGFDVLLDEQLHPYLLEVNHSPSLGPEGQVASEVKTDMFRDLLALADVGFYRFGPLQRRIAQAKDQFRRQVSDTPASLASDYSARMLHLASATDSASFDFGALTDEDIVAFLQAEDELDLCFNSNNGFQPVFPSSTVAELEVLLKPGTRSAVFARMLRNGVSLSNTLDLTR